MSKHSTCRYALNKKCEEFFGDVLYLIKAKDLSEEEEYKITSLCEKEGINNTDDIKTIFLIVKRLYKRDTFPFKQKQTFYEQLESIHTLFQKIKKADLLQLNDNSPVKKLFIQFADNSRIELSNDELLKNLTTFALPYLILFSKQFQDEYVLKRRKPSKILKQRGRRTDKEKAILDIEGQILRFLKRNEAQLPHKSMGNIIIQLFNLAGFRQKSSGNNQGKNTHDRIEKRLIYNKERNTNM